MVLREQALDTHTSYLLLVQQAALSPQKGDKHKKHLALHNVFYVYRRIYFPSGTSCHCFTFR